MTDDYRRPRPIDHTCDGSNLTRCECARSRRRENDRARQAARTAANTRAREQRQAERWADEPIPQPRKVQVDPLVHTCDGSLGPKQCECYRTWMREYQRRRRAGMNRPVDVNRRHNLWRLYRITPEEVEALRVAQDGRCAICGRHEDEVAHMAGGRPRLDGTPAARRGLVVDHCHRRGNVRALLCSPYNQGLGHFNDDVRLLRAAADWLESQ